MLQSLNRHYWKPIRSFGRSARLYLVMTIIDGVIYSGWQLFFNFYMLQSGYSIEFLGLVNSMPSAAALVFGILIGRFSDRIGRKSAMMIGIACSTVCMLAEVTVRQPGLIVAAAFLNGIFNSLFLVSQAPLMMKLSDSDNRTMLFSLNWGLQTLSGAVGSVFAAQLPALFATLLSVSAGSATAYQAVLITSMVVGASSLVPLWLMKEPPGQAEALPAGAPGTASRPAASGITRPLLGRTLQMTVPQIVIGLGAAILIPYMNVFFKGRFDISDSSLGLLFSLSSLLIGIGSIIVPHLSTRLGGKVRAIVMTQTASLGFLLLAGFAPVLWMSATGFLLRAALMNMASPLYSAFCMEHTPERHQGFVNSFLNVSWNIGWAVGPYVSGVVQQRYGFAPLFIATAVLYALANVLTWSFFRHTENAVIIPQAALPAVELAE
ncbi:MAG: MFS transporter [Anaerolineae bacterium]